MADTNCTTTAEATPKGFSVDGEAFEVIRNLALDNLTIADGLAATAEALCRTDHADKLMLNGLSSAILKQAQHIQKVACDIDQWIFDAEPSEDIPGFEAKVTAQDYKPTNAEKVEELADYHDAWYRMLETVNAAIGAVSDDQSLVARLSTVGAFIIDYARNDAEELRGCMLRQAETQEVTHGIA